MIQKMGFISIIIFFIAGTKDSPQDHIDDLKLPFGDTLNKTKRGRDADMYYRSHNGEIDTVTGHSLGGAVSLALENHIKKKVTIHMVQHKVRHSVLQLYQVI